MKTTIQAIAFCAAAFATIGATFAQAHAPVVGSLKSSSARGMMSAEQMMKQCEQMMKDMRSDPVLMKHMNQIMQKHMMHGMMNGASMMNGSLMNGAHPSPTQIIEHDAARQQIALGLRRTDWRG